MQGDYKICHGSMVLAYGDCIKHVTGVPKMYLNQLVVGTLVNPGSGLSSSTGSRKDGLCLVELVGVHGVAVGVQRQAPLAARIAGVLSTGALKSGAVCVCCVCACGGGGGGGGGESLVDMHSTEVSPYACLLNSARDGVQACG